MWPKMMEKNEAMSEDRKWLGCLFRWVITEDFSQVVAFNQNPKRGIEIN